MNRTKSRQYSVFTLAGLTLVALGTLWPPSALAVEVRATFLDKCPTTNEPSAKNPQPEALEALLLGLGSAVLDKAVDAGIAAVKKVLVPEARSTEGYFIQEGLYAYRKSDSSSRTIPNPNLACLVVAVGTFGPASTPWQLPFDVDEERKDAVQTLTRTLGLNGPPAMYLEAVRRFSYDKSAMTWRPTRAYVGGYLNDSFFAGSSRGIAIEMNLYKPGQDKPFTTESFNFDEVTKPWSKGAAELQKGEQGRWLALPAASKPSEIQGLEASASGAAFDPFTLNVRVVESPKPYQLAQMFSDAVTAKSADIKQVVQETVNPVARQAAATTAKQAAVTALQTFQADLKGAADACATANIGTDAGKLNCEIAKAKATLSRANAVSACEDVGGDGVQGCKNLPATP